MPSFLRIRETASRAAGRARGIVTGTAAGDPQATNVPEQNAAANAAPGSQATTDASTSADPAAPNTPEVARGNSSPAVSVPTVSPVTIATANAGSASLEPFPRMTAAEIQDAEPEVNGPPAYENACNDRLRYSPGLEGRDRANDPEVIFEVPGVDRYPSNASNRVVNGNWLRTPAAFTSLFVGGQEFTVPFLLLSQFEAFRFLLRPSPPRGWHLQNVHPTIFSLFLEMLISPAGFLGTEQGINLVSLLSTLHFALAYNLGSIVERLRRSIYRYISQRVLHFNPWVPDLDGILDHQYLTFRAQEIYRAWRLVTEVPVLQDALSVIDLEILFSYVVTDDVWPAVMADMMELFGARVEQARNLLQFHPANDFEEFFLYWLNRAGNLSVPWPLPSLRSPRGPLELAGDDDDAVPEVPPAPVIRPVDYAGGEELDIVPIFNINDVAASEYNQPAPVVEIRIPDDNELPRFHHWNHDDGPVSDHDDDDVEGILPIEDLD